MEERYESLKELGTGNFGVARLVRDKRTKELVAVKYIERGNKVPPFELYFRIYLVVVRIGQGVLCLGGFSSGCGPSRGLCVGVEIA
jgi:hypothetical protein